MLIEKRLSEIVRIVNERKSVTVQELTELLNASESTIRRDLTVLHNHEQLVKVHGGATALGMIGINYYTKDDAVENRKDLNREEKIKIAKFAASLIKANDFVYLDAGTTTEIMIDFITEVHAVFVTNAIAHAKKLVQKGFTAYLVGGELKPVTEAIVGSEALISLEKYNFTIGFWGANGVSLNTGFSTPDVNESLVKQKSMGQCRKKYILCDSSKFNQVSPVTFADFGAAEIITTKVNDENYKKCKNILEVEKG